jgi:hypothetical protein
MSRRRVERKALLRASTASESVRVQAGGEAVIAHRLSCLRERNSPETFFFWLLETMSRSLELPRMLPVLH